MSLRVEGALANVPARQIIRALGDAAKRWCDADFPPRVRVARALEERLGYAEPVVDFALDRLFESIAGPTILAVVCDELGSPDALDGFAARAGRVAAHARALGRVVILASDRTIGVALVPAVFALCAKNDVTVKDRLDGLTGAFFATLAEELPAFAPAAQAGVWTGGDAAVEQPLFDGADLVAVFGADDTLRSVRERLPAHARFIGFGHRASAGFVQRDVLDEETTALRFAREAARDCVLYETEGCLSLHVVFVEDGATVGAARFAALLAQAMEELEIEFPPARREPATAARIASVRNLAAFRAVTGRGAVYEAGRSGVVIFDPPADEPPSFLPRTLGVIPVEGPAAALAYVRRHGIPLEGFAVAALHVRDDTRRCAIESGASQIVASGQLQSPPLSANHGGYGRIAPFVRWISAGW